MVVEGDQGRAAAARRRTLVTEEFTQTGLSRRHTLGGRRRAGRPRPRRRAAAGEHDGGLLRARAARRRAVAAASTRAREGREALAYSSSWCPAGPAVMVAASNHAWNSAVRLALASSNGVGAVQREHLRWSNSSQPSSSTTSASQPAARDRGRRRSRRCRRIEPRTTTSGRTPRAASAAPSSRDCSSPSGGEHVVVGGAPGRLAVPDQQQHAHAAASSISRLQRSLEVAATSAGTGVGLVGGLPVVVAVVDLLGDHAEPEQPEHLVEPPLLRGHREPGARGVVLDDLGAGEHPGQVRRLAAELRGRTRRRRPGSSRPARRRGPSAGRRGWPSPSRGRRRPAAGRRRSSTTLSNRKSLWITQFATSVGLVLVEPGHHPLVVADVVGARRCGSGRTSRRPAARRSRRPCRGRRARPPTGSTACSSTSTSRTLVHSVRAPARGAASSPSGRSRRRIDAVEPLHHVEVRADHGLVVAEARPSPAT